MSETLRTCQVNDLYAAFSGPNGAGAHNYYTFGIVNVSVSECVLPGPPALRFLGSDGSELTIPLTNGVPCTGVEGQGCISAGSDQLRPGQPTPYFSIASSSHPASGQQGQVSLTFVVPVSGLFPDCVNPVPATIGLVFPGVTGEVDASIPQGYASGDCWHDVELLGYGPSATGISPTTLARACTLADLAGAFVREGVALGTTHIMFGISDAGADACTLGSPTEVHLEDAEGHDLGIPYTTNAVCDGTDAPCVSVGTIKMLPRQATPAASPEVSGQVRVDIAIGNIANIDPPCAAGTLQAHTLGLVFPGTGGELRIPFPSDVGVQTCRPQVMLFQFG